MDKVFRWLVVKKTWFDILLGIMSNLNRANDKLLELERQARAESAALCDTITRQQTEISRLSGIERKYKQLTARDERGRFVKREGD